MCSNLVKYVFENNMYFVVIEWKIPCDLKLIVLIKASVFLLVSLNAWSGFEHLWNLPLWLWKCIFFSLGLSNFCFIYFKICILSETVLSSFYIQEHEKRCWSVDFNLMDPKLLASGSDDAKGTVWIPSPNLILFADKAADICWNP